MAQRRGTRSALASLVGYVLLAIIVYFVFRVFVGTLFWLIRTIVIVVLIGGLFTLYVKLKVPRK